MFVCISNSVATKKGNKEGITELAHRERPFFTAGKFELEKINKQKTKLRKSAGKKSFFKFNTIIFNVSLLIKT